MAIKRDAYEYAQRAGIPESLKGQLPEILAQGIVEQCKAHDMTEEQLRAFTVWNFLLFTGMSGIGDNTFTGGGPA